jgi:hypothetical protein
MANKSIRYIKLPNGDVVGFSGPQLVTCSTSASSQTKVVTLKNIPISGLPNGFTFNVRMVNAQRYNGKPYLMVRVNTGTGSGGTPVYAEVATGPIARADENFAGVDEWDEGEVLTFVYGTIDYGDGTETAGFYIVNGGANNRTFKSMSINGLRYYAGDPYQPKITFDTTHFGIGWEETVPEPPETESYLGDVSVSLKVATTSETSTYLNIS